MEDKPKKKWRKVIFISILVIVIGIGGVYLGTNYSIKSKKELKKIDKVIAELESSIQYYQKQEEDFQQKVKSLQSDIRLKDKELKKKDGEIAEAKETSKEIDEESLVATNQENIEEVPAGSNPEEAYKIPTWEELQGEDTVTNTEPYTMEALYTSTIDLDDYGYDLLIVVQITNHTNERIEVKPHTLKLEVNNDDYAILNENETRELDKFTDSMPIYGMLIAPNQTASGAIIYDVENENSSPVSISWHGPAGTVEYYFSE